MTNLRYGWTTGACAAASAKAAFCALTRGKFCDPVDISLPRGRKATFTLERKALEENHAFASVIKDAGDDPDVTHGAEIWARVRLEGDAGQIIFRAGEGVGTVRRPGLPLPVGEPAINPAPRKIISDNLLLVSQGSELPGLVIEIGVTHGEAIAKKTWNARLGIEGGLSILGTTGLVVPYSCSAWIHSIHRGIDVIAASGAAHAGAATGSMSEKLLWKVYGLEPWLVLDMGNFVGGMIRYLRKKPLANLTIAGGLGKMAKLAQGASDLHSQRSTLNLEDMARRLVRLGLDPKRKQDVLEARSALEIVQTYPNLSKPLCNGLAQDAIKTIRKRLNDRAPEIEGLIAERQGKRLNDRAPEIEGLIAERQGKRLNDRAPEIEGLIAERQGKRLNDRDPEIEGLIAERQGKQLNDRAPKIEVLIADRQGNLLARAAENNFSNAASKTIDRTNPIT